MKKTEIIKIKSGNLQGYINEGISIFKGIPYAEPPIGELRLNNPKSKKDWDDVLEATEFGPEAPQPYNLNTPLPRPIQSEENCLTLNIWTPANDSEKRPVMVWIHGGAFIYGSSSRRLYDGLHLVQRGNVVVVTINYRLGPFANFFIPGAKANAGMLDQILALEWVKDNIGYFGGDTENVTIFGESAGAFSVCALMVMPKAKGLFNRVIAQSGAAHPLGLRKSVLKRSSEELMSELNLKPDQIDTFRKLPWVDIIKATHRLNRKAASRGIRLSFSPYIDGDTIPHHPLKAINEGYAKDIELIIGSNFEESKFNHLVFPNFKPADLNNLSKRMNGQLRLTIEKDYDLDNIINTYRTSREKNKLPAEPQDILDAFNTDNTFRIPAIKFAEAQSKHQKNTYMYLFSWRLPNIYGAMHGLEIGFIFNRFFNVDIPTLPKKSEETETLSKNMMDSWIRFARTGNPNHTSIPKWPSYDIENRSTIIFDKEIKIWDDPLKKERKMWFGMNSWSRYP